MGSGKKSGEEAGRPRGVLAVWTDVAPEHEADFNEWYWREHLPERVSVPGFRRGWRYRALAGAPRYFAAYDLDGVAVLDSAPYRERLDHPAEWTRRVMPGFRATTRAGFELAASLGEVEGAVLLSLRLTPHPERRAGLEAGLRDELLPRLHALPGIVRVRHWRGVPIGAPTVEAGLRGGPDTGCDTALIVEAATEGDLAAAHQALRADAALARALTAPPIAGTYALLCSLGGA